MGTIHRARAFLGIERDDYARFLVRGYAVHDGFAANPALFVAPSPTLPALLGLLLSYADAQRAMSSHTRVLTETRNLCAGELLTGLETARSYVQALCDAAPAEAPLLIAAAGMILGRATSYQKPLLQAKQSQPGGPVHLVANVGLLTRDVSGKVSFNWQLSGDGGASWLSLPSTPHGNTFAAGLTPLHTYLFRASVSDVNGPAAWTDGVAFLVH